jgi:two-component system phosphate regulon sensor histidine kinase PhoR
LTDCAPVTIDYQHFFQNLLDAAPWPVIIIDRCLSIRFYNALAGQLFGTNSPLLGKQLDAVVADAAIMRLVQESISGEKVCSGEFTHGTSGRTWNVSVTPLEHAPAGAAPAAGAHGEKGSSPYAYFAIAIEDLTELRRLERVRRDFIANISHELRTPLASVRLLAETLEEAIDTDRDKAQMFLEKIETEVMHLTGLVAELLELSRIESGLVPMVIEPVEAGQLVHEVMARMLPQAQRHRVTLHTEIEQGNRLVAADSKQIARVLVNLVHNAIKFTPSGGSVTVGTFLQPGGQSQRFFVRDTGVGIRPQELSRIFERFYKADRARSKTDFIGPGGGGSGLGLAIARHVVEAHGGLIKAESTPGNGSTFTFTLPVAVRGEGP